MTPDRRVLATLLILVLAGAVRVAVVIDADELSVSEDLDNKEDS